MAYLYFRKRRSFYSEREVRKLVIDHLLKKLKKKSFAKTFNVKIFRVLDTLILERQEKKMYPNHEKDVYGWAIHTVQLLREKRMNEVDFDGIIEEIEALGRSEKYELINRLSLIISHLLKWQFQPNMRGHNWIYTIREQRTQAKIHLRNNPGLKGKITEILEDAYAIALSKAARETGLEEKVFPDQCYYSFDQILDEKFYPESK